MFSSIFELPKEYVWVSEVAISTPFGRFVAEFLGDLQPLRVVADGACEVTQQVARVAQVAASATHRLPVTEATHQLQILSDE